ncbi:hypothetical protein RQM59_08605 [Flavobacteriaceae bacterium S356]|uniref:Uncharacterized protein n=1 Tax=Asprobacillus argus TaxID=3076534 RepID=A0ABU3LG91_9FLAO|nr:hypothetical protein [Flavobacteriaceae bacterium S356]
MPAIKVKVELTHLWVTDFGWEDTILIEEDFQELEILGTSNEDGVVFIGTQTDKSKRQILKGTLKQ